MEDKARKIGIYVHIPFCLRKCSYCDFYSLGSFENGLLEQYVKALIKEIEEIELKEDAIFPTVYIGGGTPSLLSGSQMELLLKTLNRKFNLRKDTEITVEANPATLPESRISHFYNAGVNRFSLGVQSFDNFELEVLGRTHTVKEVFETVDALHRSGIKNFNLDIIYGIPDQTVKKWENNIKKAIECNPSHISMYLLQLDESTPLAKRITEGKFTLPDEEMVSDFYYIGTEYLENSGFEHYELSNFCRPGFVCRHNMIYWHAEEYIGLGAGAVSYLEGRRFVNIASVYEYIRRLEKGLKPLQEELEFMNTSEMLAADAIILGLRLCRGINLLEFKMRFGIDIEKKYKTIIEKYEKEKLLEIKNGYIYLTKKGYFISNDILCRFIV
ncbi:radical SAM family heme chaperone HemW [Thermosyntropha sp.]|uniref:radical SAM family heme chaperone HemW n=1 Tax=Thermosyntropha sp. TaxID=2740820 RepID=UPI0025DDC654|nr:radical SAM family heme chaperone HemW [Thermosyntropha sp.]MBO8159158.1 radical SAM family heme chaperone HemW [Thermosyntropha sp.]